MSRFAQARFCAVMIVLIGMALIGVSYLPPKDVIGAALGGASIVGGVVMWFHSATMKGLR